MVMRRKRWRRTYNHKKYFLKKFNFFSLNFFLIFLYYFNVLISKIILKNKYYYTINIKKMQFYTCNRHAIVWSVTLFVFAFLRRQLTVIITGEKIYIVSYFCVVHLSSTDPRQVTETKSGNLPTRCKNGTIVARGREYPF